MNFLIDEAFDTGKGANAVISMVHYYLENHGVHAVILHFNDTDTGAYITCVCVCILVLPLLSIYST